MSNEAGAVADQTNDSKGLVPKLRFPEFRDSGEWQLYVLSDLLTETKKKNRDLNYGPEHVLSVSGEHGCVNQIEFMGRSYAGASVKEYNVVANGDIVYTKSPLKACPNGIIKANKGMTGIVSVLYAVYRTTALTTPEFIDYFFSSDYNLNTYLQPLVKKGPKNSILVNNSDVLKGRISAPDVAEQQKIAECLKSLDALIAADTEKLAALRDHKKGLMQRLFPRPERVENGVKIPAETTPRLRFPEFRDAGDWEWTSVDAIAEIFKGKGISKADIVTDGQQPCIRYGELYTTYGEVIDEVTSRTNVTKRDLFMSRANDVIIPSSGETKIDIATAACVLHADIALGGDLNVIRSAHDGTFLSYFFNGPLKYSIAKVAQGDSVVHLYPSQIGSLNIAIPSADEQRRIADTLFAVDRALVERRHRIVALNAHKSGLMQQLFLSPYEATQ